MQKQRVLLKSLFLFVLIGVYTTLIAQRKSVQFNLVDQDTHKPISNAHVFVNNSTFGANSDMNGYVELLIPQEVHGILTISHISYQMKNMGFELYDSLNSTDSIFLKPNKIDLSEIVIAEKRSKKWKKNFKKFQKALLGESKAAAKCKIQNPEVLRFENRNNRFVATAIDMLKVNNDYLAYQIDFLLSELSIEADGSMNYAGKAWFHDLNISKLSDKIIKRRKEEYEASSKFFYSNLIKDNLENVGLSIRIVKYNKGRFEVLSVPEISELLSFDTLNSYYKLEFPEFLEVTHRNNKNIINRKTQFMGKGLESTRFNNLQDSGNSRIEFIQSYLFKISPFMKLDASGNLLDQSVVKEYGFWAGNRLANQLPFNYGDVYKENREPNTFIPVTGLTSGLLKKEDQVESGSEQKTVILQKNEFENFLQLLNGNTEEQDQSLEFIRNNWKKEYIPPLLDIYNYSRNLQLSRSVMDVIQQKSGIRKKDWNYLNWLSWLWESEENYGSYYSNVKAEVFKRIDDRFEKYFKDRQGSSKIRLDEIVWGGVVQDGIPPLRYPELIKAEEAVYLNENDVVFGIALNGEFKAYPKRILAWHEFFTDTFGDTHIAGVYCTLCGTMIAYDLSQNGVRYDLGTSGFLYRSNKLMYDAATQSLWNTIEGTPVLGPLVKKDIHLRSYPVVTTRWGDWKKQHPQTQVLSLNTGHKRDYSEGKAYQEYFATDDLMFPVPLQDKRMKNKDEVMVVRVKGYQEDPLAISLRYLRKKKIFQGEIADKKIVVIADKHGEARAYFAQEFKFNKFEKEHLVDSEGKKWTYSEEFLISHDRKYQLERVVSHNIFWFAWKNMYPETRLIK